MQHRGQEIAEAVPAVLGRTALGHAASQAGTSARRPAEAVGTYHSTGRAALDARDRTPPAAWRMDLPRSGT
ncbi:hypothetical protein [Streptomyces peucetius]|uniref:PmrA n=1 Tax=Streptomyces peucetius TaxID=1950 RepID=A0ABY6I1L7_STRPE|nr:hypothetical protein [Streptomyces peucetius]UYQ60871.1 hypothetical protein OGH68_04905 [Streptomyces peucetius]